MAKPPARQSLLPSLLDQLIDDDPAQREEQPRPAVVQLREIRANIRRDLEWLLNTRLPHQPQFDRWPELRSSLLTYGLPDFSTVLLGSAEHREIFRATVQGAIERMEPRLRRVTVEVSPTGDEHDRTLYLRIAAVLQVEPAPVPLLFDSRLHRLDRTLQLRELQHG